MENKKVITIEWDDSLSGIDNRVRRIKEIIKGVKCKKPDDIREKYLSIYINDDDYLPYERNPSYQSKALKKIPNLIIPNGKNDYYEIEEDIDHAFYNKLNDLFKENKMKIGIVQTARVVLPRNSANEFITLIEEQFTNIVSIETRYVTNNKEALFITYTKKMPRPKAKTVDGEEVYSYDESDFYETMRLINIDA